jgi:hypothetical protein
MNNDFVTIPKATIEKILAKLEEAAEILRGEKPQ